jgi:hypothetical protein
VDWIGLAKDRDKWRALVNSALNLRVPWNAGKLSSGLTTGGLSSSAQLHRVSLDTWSVLTCGWWKTRGFGDSDVGPALCTHSARLSPPQSIFSDCWDPKLEFLSDFVLKQGSVKTLSSAHLQYDETCFSSVKIPLFSFLFTTTSRLSLYISSRSKPKTFTSSIWNYVLFTRKLKVFQLNLPLAASSVNLTGMASALSQPSLTTEPQEVCWLKRLAFSSAV